MPWRVRRVGRNVWRGLRRIGGVLTQDVLEPGVRSGGIITLPREGSDQLFFLYTGAAHRLGLDPRAFFTRTRLFERNVVLMRDEHCAYYQRGLSSSSLDSFDALLAWHREYRASLPHVRRVFCLGTSMGAYAAVLFGHLLVAEQVWALGPAATCLDGFADIPAERADLAVLLARPNGVTTYHVHYSEGCRRDVQAVQRIAGCAGVKLWPHPGQPHNVVLTMLEQGTLEALLPEPR